MKGFSMKFWPWIGHRLRELFLYKEWLTQPSSKSVIFFPSSGKGDGASYLRAYCIADELKKIGWRTVVVPHQLELLQRLRIVKLLKPDILYFQMTRHESNRFNYFEGERIVFDIDDADYLDASKVNDIEVFCRNSLIVITGSQTVKAWCESFNKSTHVIWTGTPDNVAPKLITKPSKRDAIVAWGCSSSQSYPAELNFMIEVMDKLSNKCHFTFRLYGVTNIEEAIRSFGFLTNKGVSVEYFEYMSYQSFLDSLAYVAVGLNPLLPQKSKFSEGKSFGKVLAYLVSKCVVVASDEVDHSQFFRNASSTLNPPNNKNGELVSTVDEWVNSIEKYIKQPLKRDAITEQASIDFEAQLTSKVSAKKVSDLLDKLI